MNEYDFRSPQAGQAAVSATVKWFNPTKGFGFVQLTDGSADAFLHISVVERAGERDMPPGATLNCDITQSPRGPQVAEIHSVDRTTAAESAPMGAGGAAPRRGSFDEGEPERSVDGAVKFFDAEKGFGFIVPDDGGRDVYVSLRTLERAGIQPLQPQQRVRMGLRMGQRGPMAATIELL